MNLRALHPTILISASADVIHCGRFVLGAYMFGKHHSVLTTCHSLLGSQPPRLCPGVIDGFCLRAHARALLDLLLGVERSTRARQQDGDQMCKSIFCFV